jgi:hypothetical protein
MNKPDPLDGDISPEKWIWLILFLKNRVRVISKYAIISLTYILADIID